MIIVCQLLIILAMLAPFNSLENVHLYFFKSGFFIEWFLQFHASSLNLVLVRAI